MNLAFLSSELDKILQRDLAYSWDNAGLLVGERQSEITSVTLALELSEEVIEDALKNGSNMIITHHPLIFSSLKSVTDKDKKQSYIIRLIHNKIALYSAHTNFDRIKGGLNDYVIRLLDVDEVSDFAKEDDGYYIGKTAKLKNQMTAKEFVSHVCKKFKLGSARLITDNIDKPINHVALVTGSGADYIVKASDVADVLITGDVKYHDAQDAFQRGDTVIDAGHFGTEKFFADAMDKFLLENLCCKMSIYKSDGLKDPFRTWVI